MPNKLKTYSLKYITILIACIFIIENTAYGIAVSNKPTLRIPQTFSTKEGKGRFLEIQLEVLEKHYSVNKAFSKEESLKKLDSLFEMVPNIHSPKMYSIEEAKGLIEQDKAVVVRTKDDERLKLAFISPIDAHKLSDEGVIIVKAVTLPGEEIINLNIQPVFKPGEVEGLVGRAMDESDKDKGPSAVREMLRNTKSYDIKTLKEMLESGKERDSALAAAVIILRGGQFATDGAFNLPADAKGYIVKKGKTIEEISSDIERGHYLGNVRIIKIFYNNQEIKLGKDILVDFNLAKQFKEMCKEKKGKYTYWKEQASEIEKFSKLPVEKLIELLQEETEQGGGDDSLFCITALQSKGATFEVTKPVIKDIQEDAENFVVPEPEDLSLLSQDFPILKGDEVIALFGDEFIEGNFENIKKISNSLKPGNKVVIYAKEKDKQKIALDIFIKGLLPAGEEGKVTILGSDKEVSAEAFAKIDGYRKDSPKVGGVHCVIIMPIDVGGFPELSFAASKAREEDTEKTESFKEGKAFRDFVVGRRMRHGGSIDSDIPGLFDFLIQAIEKLSHQKALGPDILKEIGSMVPELRDIRIDTTEELLKSIPTDINEKKEKGFADKWEEDLENIFDRLKLLYKKSLDIDSKCTLSEDSKSALEPDAKKTYDSIIEYIDESKKYAVKLIKILQEGLDFIKEDVKKERLSINSTIENALANPDLSSEGKEIKAVLGQNLPDVFVNQRMIISAITNILFNNIEMEEITSVEINSGLERKDDGSEWVVIKISDNGPGIPKKGLDPVLPGKDYQYIFDFGWSLRKGGTGFGLAETRVYLEEHGGSIEAASKKGKGSTFTIRLPVSGTNKAIDSTTDSFVQCNHNAGLHATSRATIKNIIIEYNKLITQYLGPEASFEVFVYNEAWDDAYHELDSIDKVILKNEIIELMIESENIPEEAVYFILKNIKRSFEDEKFTAIDTELNSPMRETVAILNKMLETLKQDKSTAAGSGIDDEEDIEIFGSSAPIEWNDIRYIEDDLLKGIKGSLQNIEFINFPRDINGDNSKVILDICMASLRKERGSYKIWVDRDNEGNVIKVKLMDEMYMMAKTPSAKAKVTNIDFSNSQIDVENLKENEPIFKKDKFTGFKNDLDPDIMKCKDVITEPMNLKTNKQRGNIFYAINEIVSNALRYQMLAEFPEPVEFSISTLTGNDKEGKAKEILKVSVKQKSGQADAVKMLRRNKRDFDKYGEDFIKFRKKGKHYTGIGGGALFVCDFMKHTDVSLNYKIGEKAKGFPIETTLYISLDKLEPDQDPAPKSAEGSLSKSAITEAAPESKTKYSLLEAKRNPVKIVKMDENTGNTPIAGTIKDIEGVLKKEAYLGECLVTKIAYGDNIVTLQKPPSIDFNMAGIILAEYEKYKASSLSSGGIYVHIMPDIEKFKELTEDKLIELLQVDRQNGEWFLYLVALQEKGATFEAVKPVLDPIESNPLWNNSFMQDIIRVSEKYNKNHAGLIKDFLVFNFGLSTETMKEINKIKEEIDALDNKGKIERANNQYIDEDFETLIRATIKNGASNEESNPWLHAIGDKMGIFSLNAIRMYDSVRGRNRMKTGIEIAKDRKIIIRNFDYIYTLISAVNAMAETSSTGNNTTSIDFSNSRIDVENLEESNVIFESDAFMGFDIQGPYMMDKITAPMGLNTYSEKQQIFLIVDELTANALQYQMLPESSEPVKFHISILTGNDEGLKAKEILKISIEQNTSSPDARERLLKNKEDFDKMEDFIDTRQKGPHYTDIGSGIASLFSLKEQTDFSLTYDIGDEADNFPIRTTCYISLDKLRSRQINAQQFTQASTAGIPIETTEKPALNENTITEEQRLKAQEFFDALDEVGEFFNENVWILTENMADSKAKIIDSIIPAMLDYGHFNMDGLIYKARFSKMKQAVNDYISEVGSFAEKNIAEEGVFNYKIASAIEEYIDFLKQQNEKLNDIMAYFDEFGYPSIIEANIRISLLDADSIISENIGLPLLEDLEGLEWVDIQPINLNKGITTYMFKVAPENINIIAFNGDGEDFTAESVVGEINEPSSEKVASIIVTDLNKKEALENDPVISSLIEDGRAFIAYLEPDSPAAVEWNNLIGGETSYDFKGISVSEITGNQNLIKALSQQG